MRIPKAVHPMQVDWRSGFFLLPSLLAISKNLCEVSFSSTTDRVTPADFTAVVMAAASPPNRAIRIPAPDGPTLDLSRVPKLGSGSLAEWLSNFTAASLLQPNFSLVVLDSEASWVQALETLTRKNILSAPIFNRELKAFIGLVDVVDLLAWGLKVIQDVHIPVEELEQWAFKSLPVQLMKDMSLRNPWCPTYIGKPLNSLVDMFSSRVSLHRVPLVDQDGRVVGLVSQSRLIYFLAEHQSVIAEAPELQVPILKCMSSPVLSLNKNMKTKDALAMLLKSRVSGMAVVDDEGRLLSQLSAADVKGLTTKGLFHALELPLGEFLRESAQRRAKRVEVLTAYPHQPILHAVRLMASNHHLHRVFVISEEGKPVGVLTMGNVMEAISVRKT